MGLHRPAGLKSNVRKVADARHITHARERRKHKRTDRSVLLTFSPARLKCMSGAAQRHKNETEN
ncbi:protein of unknown function [Azospirillum lipoferum 4B]|uniref:Uncharacterized protein n=1 Tax=Azospirillum lipoferum (strain 4B) TaxID=862719 RepID=G7Z6L2_AZOL4|nr:protein of unknown function [Azospirillum lipoferum 4B]